MVMNDGYDWSFYFIAACDLFVLWMVVVWWQW